MEPEDTFVLTAHVVFHVPGKYHDGHGLTKLAACALERDMQEAMEVSFTHGALVELGATLDSVETGYYALSEE